MKRTLLVGGLIALTTQMAVAQQTDSIKVRQLQEVSVVGTRAGLKTPMTYGNIKKDEIRKVNLGQDVPYLLQLQPSVVATSDAGTGIGYTGIRVRGVDATATNVTANGVPINDSESQGVFWVNMPDLSSSLEEMQLQRGVGTSSNGAGAFGASLNMRTSNLSSLPYAELGLSGGSYGTFRRNVRVGTGTIGGHWALDARLSKINSDGYIDRASVDLSSYFVQAGYFNERTVLKFISFGGKEVTGIAWHGISPEVEAKYGRRYNQAGDMLIGGEKGKRYYHNTDNYEQIHNHLILTHSIAPQLSLNLTGHYTKGYGYTDEYRTGRRLREYNLAKYTNAAGKEVEKVSLIRRKYLDNDFAGIISNINWRPRKWDISFGLSANYYKGLHYGEVRWIDNYPTPIDPTARYYDGDGKKTDIASYLKASHQLTPTLSVYGDLQYRYINFRLSGTADGYSRKVKGMHKLELDTHFNFLNPKAGLFWQVASGHDVYASVAVAHREPNRKMYTNLGADGKAPKAERMVDYELGYKHTGRKFSLGANLYYMDYKDQLVMNGQWSDVGEAVLENVPKSYRLGLELSASLRPTTWLRLDGSLALSKNKIKEYTYTFDAYDPSSYDWVASVPVVYKDIDIAYSPSLVASGAVTFSKSGFEASLSGQAVGAQYLDNTQSAERQIDAYQLVNLRLAYDLPIRRFVKGWNISLSINNLLNKTYYSNGYVYDMGVKADGSSLYNDLRYFPQAGINFLLGTTLTF